MESSVSANISIQLTRTHLTLAPLNKTPRYSLIFLHGIEMSIQKFFSVFLSSSIIGLLQDFKIHIPQAPIRPIAMRGGIDGFSWYSLTPESFQEASDNTKAMIRREIEECGNDPKRVFVGGFSQGTTLALDAGLTFEQKLGGIIVIGGFISDLSKLEGVQDIPDTLIVHGLKDQRVTWEHAEKSYKPILGKGNVKTALLEDMEHDLYSEEAKKIVHDFIRERAKNK